jgi:hypothetical protein
LYNCEDESCVMLSSWSVLHTMVGRIARAS